LWWCRKAGLKRQFLVESVNEKDKNNIMSTNKKSPIKDKTLRHPGQSLDEKLDKLINQDGTEYYFLAAILLIWTGYEWWQYYSNSPPNPIPITLIALAVVPYSIYKLFKIYKEIRSIKLGREGERAVGQFLERLRADGCVVFHDIIGDNFNLDHVIVSKKGIYTIETKTYSKPEKGEAKILFDGEKLTIQGSGTYDQPVIQVKSASTWLKNTIKATTGKTFAIKPVILFPGWYVESSEKGKKSGTWVLNPKSLPSFINNQPDMISQEDTQMVVFHLCRYVRMKESERLS
jgi:hypothetical protein